MYFHGKQNVLHNLLSEVYTASNFGLESLEVSMYVTLPIVSNDIVPC